MTFRFLFVSSQVLVAALLLPGCEKPPPDMVKIPSGPFLMGTDRVDSEQHAIEVGFPHPWYEDEHPLRKLRLPAFFIDQHEVTNEKYLPFVRGSNRHPPQNWSGGTYPAEKAKHPVVYVSWYDADAYCRWSGKRLPTEEEWEKAARGPDGLDYPWGNEFEPRKARMATGSVMFNTPGPVGGFEMGKSPYAVYDMIGNVWEWTDGWYEPYPGNTAVNENFGQKLRVTRGLSFMSVGHFGGEEYMEVAAIVARASFRSYDYPTSRLGDVGFRCAQSIR
jgi:formylglycine-generating enzyme required for sulfatase activity